MKQLVDSHKTTIFIINGFSHFSSENAKYSPIFLNVRILYLSFSYEKMNQIVLAFGQTLKKHLEYVIFKKIIIMKFNKIY